jgi:phosphoketolase
MPKAPSPAERTAVDAYWRAANYLSVGQIQSISAAIRC